MLAPCEVSPGDGESMFLGNVSNTAHFHAVPAPKRAGLTLYIPLMHEQLTV